MNRERLETYGWILFLICAPMFLISGLRSGDVWTVAGSIAFGRGVILFLVPAKPGK
ncbi:MAG: hypothetical protein QF554_02680 [Dehalococcoidia bacterium]|nr:hypothetical protein [Dehalococcoidia bacterium]